MLSKFIKITPKLLTKDEKKNLHFILFNLSKIKIISL
jgi:hypothetical protein